MSEQEWCRDLPLPVWSCCFLFVALLCCLRGLTCGKRAGFHHLTWVFSFGPFCCKGISGWQILGHNPTGTSNNPDWLEGIGCFINLLSTWEQQRNENRLSWRCYACEKCWIGQKARRQNHIRVKLWFYSSKVVVFNFKYSAVFSSSSSRIDH